MAQLASVNASIASSSTAQQISTPRAPEHPTDEFLAMLTQATDSSGGTTGSTTSGTSQADGSSSSAARTTTQASSHLETTISSLLKRGVSIDKITNAIASKLVSLTGGQKGATTTAKVKAVADYLRNGESSRQDPASTAHDIVRKVKSLVAAVQQQKTPAAATSRTSDAQASNESGSILDASQAGEKPSSNTHSTSTANAAVPSTAPVTDSTNTDPTVSDQTAFAAAIDALKPSSPVPDTSSLAGGASVPVAQPVTTQSTAVPADPTLLQIAQTVAAQSAATVAANAAPAASAYNGSSGDSPSLAEQTLGQASIDTGFNVATDLNAIASGQGTALGRALLRAANVDVAKTTGIMNGHVDSALAAVSSSLDDMFADAPVDATASTTPKAAQLASLDPSLGDAALALFGSSPASTSGNQATFASALASTKQTINVDDVMDQVVHGLSIKNFTDNPTVNISLNPPDLGQLNVKLTVTNSTVSATVLTQSNDVRNILLDNRAQLDQVLANAGLKLGSLNVDVSGQGLQQDADRRRNELQQFLRTNGSPSRDASAETTAIQSTGPSMLGSVDLSLLNQLV